MRILEKTESLCSSCLKRLEAEIIERDGKVYISKTCPEHGHEEALIWSEADSYFPWAENSVNAEQYKNGSKAKHGCPYDCGYCEEHTGSTCTAVIEVTKRCNMGCAVCFAAVNGPGAGGRDKPIEKIQEMIRYTADTQGFCSLQLSGGEPTLRDDLPDIIRYACGIGFKHIQVNTNGIRIADDPTYVAALKDAGAALIYLGFDAVSDDIYRQIRNRDMFNVKQTCIENCRKAGIGVMLVPVVINGLNNHQVGDIVAYGKANIPTVKGIHFQPASRFGRYEADEDGRYTIPDLLADLEAQTDGEIKPEQMMPRKKMVAHCSFSSAYYLDESHRLISLTSREPEKKTPEAGKAEASGSYSCSSGDKAGTPMSRFARSTNDFTERYWRQNACSCKGQSPLDKFFERLSVYSFTITGMPFQDAGNIDINRVRNCCVSVIDESLKTIPLCLYYLTDRNGNRLYKEGQCTVSSKKREVSVPTV